ncbi:MANSC domain-containing protein 1 [Candoia aspera]|uniref:MANSC domain-containing protein 1 n=1 Tax=Candoia aspera TaxID=51853 RepID=UPI002FD8758D
MAVQTTWRLACLSAVLFSLMAKPSQTQRCSSEQTEDITIDIPAAFSKGIRGTDPIHAPSWEACVNACCLEKIAADKTCNYVVFNTKMKGRSPNCYRFYYPAKETCPVKRALGLMTFRIIEGKEISKSPLSLNRLPHPTVKGSLVSPKAAGFDLASTPGGLDSLPRASKKEEVFGPAGPPLEKVDGPSQHPKAGRTNSMEIFGSSLVPETSSAANTVQRPTPVKLTLARLGSQASRTVGAAAVRIPASHVPLSSPYARKTEGATLQPGMATLPQPLLPSKTRPRNSSSSSSTRPAPISSAPVRNSGLSNGQLGLEGQSPDANPGRKDAPWWSDQSILLTALFFGVLFFLLAVLLLGGKMLESLQRQHYTRLDYLINDMYANM